MPVEHVYNLDKRILKLPENVRMIFLCGVVFKRNAWQKDKRKILKDYLEKDELNFPIILEENFNIPDYAGIDLGNLHDVELLVGCFADAVVIIHESIATGAELGMFATNKSIAPKLLVVYPDSDSVEEDKINTFIDGAFYGIHPILSKEDSLVSYRPVVKDHYQSNDRYVYHTYFPNDLKTNSEARDRIDGFINKSIARMSKQLSFNEVKKFNKIQRDDSSIDYFLDGGELVIALSPSALRALLLSLLTVKSVRYTVGSSQSISEVISTIQSEFDKALVATIGPELKQRPKSVKVIIKGLENSTFRSSSKEGYRKAVGLFVFLLKAMGFLSVKSNNHKESYKFTKRFSSVMSNYDRTMSRKQRSLFSKVKQDSSV